MCRPNSKLSKAAVVVTSPSCGSVIGENSASRGMHLTMTTAARLNAVMLALGLENLREVVEV